MRLAMLLLAVLLQGAAALVALRLIRVTGHRPAWVLLTTALVLMAARRVVSFVEAEWGWAGADPLNSWLGLAVSAGMLGAILLLREHLLSLRGREARLAESETTARELVENAADAVEILDGEGRFLELNQAACERLGYRREELLGNTPAVFDPRADAAAIRARLAEVAACGGMTFETIHRTRQGFEFPVEVHATPVTYHGRPAVMSIVRDITERKRHEEALRNARKAEGLVQMAGGVAHDFNNLFQVVMANLELARNLGHLDPAAALHLERARLALDRAGVLAQRIQQFSGGVLRVLETMDLNRIAEELRSEADPGRDAFWDLHPDLPPIPLDPSQVRLAAEAALANAWEAGGPVHVRTYRRTLAAADLTVGTWAGEPLEGPCVVLDVEDHGPGIPAEDLARLFDPFFSTKGLGRGLGLAAALGIVKGHGGAIQVVSAEGLGTAVRLHLPASSTASVLASSGAPVPAPGALRGPGVPSGDGPPSGSPPAPGLRSA